MTAVQKTKWLVKTNITQQRYATVVLLPELKNSIFPTEELAHDERRRNGGQADQQHERLGTFDCVLACKNGASNEVEM